MSDSWLIQFVGGPKDGETTRVPVGLHEVRVASHPDNTNLYPDGMRAKLSVVYNYRSRIYNGQLVQFPDGSFPFDFCGQ
jgi:hypothetical protein